MRYFLLTAVLLGLSFYLYKDGVVIKYALIPLCVWALMSFLVLFSIMYDGYQERKIVRKAIALKEHVGTNKKGKITVKNRYRIKQIQEEKYREQDLARKN